MASKVFCTATSCGWALQLVGKDPVSAVAASCALASAAGLGSMGELLQEADPKPWMSEEVNIP